MKINQLQFNLIKAQDNNLPVRNVNNGECKPPLIHPPSFQLKEYKWKTSAN